MAGRPPGRGVDRLGAAQAAAGAVRQRRVERGRPSSVADHLVDGVGRHLPVGRELAAGDRDHPGGRARHPVAAGQVGGAAGGAAFTSGRSPAQVPTTSASVSGSSHRGVDGPEQVGDVVGGALRVVERAVVVGVGGADVGELAAVVGRDHGTTNTERLSLGTGTTTAMSLRTFCHGTVMCMPLAGRMVSGSPPSSRARTVVGPHAGGVDDRPGPHLEALAVGLDRRARHLTVGVVAQAHHVGVVDDDRTVVEGRGAGEGEGEPGVVGLGVVVEVGAGQAVGRQRRHVGEGLVASTAAGGACRCGPRR